MESTDSKPSMFFAAGFGDNSSMFEPMRDTPLARQFALVLLDLPGFGRAPLRGTTSLQSLADFVAEKAIATGAKIIVAHSVASIIASLAAARADCPLTTIVSLEGNLTADDAYFSGTAAQFDRPESFRAAFLERLGQQENVVPELTRYRTQVAAADPRALWELGCDARRFSQSTHPGECLAAAAKVAYLYNPENCPKASLEWLHAHELPSLIMENATHWKSVDQPILLAEKIEASLKIAA
ncbi:MAG: alpha/beta hydrolase [Pseudomonadota bacterium]